MRKPIIAWYTNHGNKDPDNSYYCFLPTVQWESHYYTRYWEKSFVLSFIWGYWKYCVQFSYQYNSDDE